MNIESSSVCGIRIKILYIDDPKIYEEIDEKTNKQKFDLNYIPTRKLVFGLDFASDLFLANKELLSELQDYYYYGQVSSFRRGIMLAKL